MAFDYNPLTGLLDLTGTGGGGGGGGSQTYVQRFTLSGTDISNKFVNLSLAPSDAQGVILTVIGGPQQDYLVDYSVTGSQVSWSSLGLDGVLSTGDKIVIQYRV